MNNRQMFLSECTRFLMACLTGLVFVLIIYFTRSDNELPTNEHSKHIRGDDGVSNGPEYAGM